MGRWEHLHKFTLAPTSHIETVTVRPKHNGYVLPQLNLIAAIMCLKYGKKCIFKHVRGSFGKMIIVVKWLLCSVASMWLLTRLNKLKTNFSDKKKTPGCCEESVRESEDTEPE